MQDESNSSLKWWIDHYGLIGWVLALLYGFSVAAVKIIKWVDRATVNKERSELPIIADGAGMTRILRAIESGSDDSKLMHDLTNQRLDHFQEAINIIIQTQQEASKRGQAHSIRENHMDNTLLELTKRMDDHGRIFEQRRIVLEGLREDVNAIGSGLKKINHDVVTLRQELDSRETQALAERREIREGITTLQKSDAETQRIRPGYIAIIEAIQANQDKVMKKLELDEESKG